MHHFYRFQVFRSIYSSIFISFYLFVFVSIYLQIYFIYLSTIYSYISLSFYLSIIIANNTFFLLLHFLALVDRLFTIKCFCQKEIVTYLNDYFQLQNDLICILFYKSLGFFLSAAKDRRTAELDSYGGGGTLPQNSAINLLGTYEKQTVKENQIDLAVIEILRYTHTQKRSCFFYLRFVLDNLLRFIYIFFL